METETRKAHAELVREGMRKKREAGGTTNKAPIGYVNKRIGNQTWVEIDPVAGPLVREAFELAATGKYSVRKLHALMVEKGLRKRDGKPLSVSAIHKMLGNLFYAGLLYSPTEMTSGQHSPLVEVHTVINAQKALSKH